MYGSEKVKEISLELFTMSSRLFYGQIRIGCQFTTTESKHTSSLHQGSHNSKPIKQ